MAVFKCKMCGGDLQVSDDASVGVCQYCGTEQTLPRLDSDRKANLYDRANHFRRSGDFDRAMGLYETILNEDGSDAEAYWSLVLCKYGVEYIEDPATHKRIPTCNRTRFQSILADADYKGALAHADGYQKELYEAEAQAIDQIQQGILAISEQEEPFDVFICYKESDDQGKRTPDSVLAAELYHELSDAGFKVFFARITLEDKLGSAYEPYIFAALNSAKVMVVIGTKAAYFNAVWVKNEWSRYLALIGEGAKKVLIPAYRDMDPYDLPEEFSHLQAQDMGKLGFMQDLIRGIEKIIGATEEKDSSARSANADESVSPTVASLLKRMFLFLEDGDWASADEYCERILDLNAELAEAYIGKLMAARQLHREEQLGESTTELAEDANFSKAMRFAAPDYREKLKTYNALSIEQAEYARQDRIYQKAIDLKNMAEGEREDALEKKKELYTYALERFSSISLFKDAKEQEKLCNDKIKIINQRQKRLDEEKKQQYSEPGFRQRKEQYLQQKRRIEETARKTAEKKTKIIKLLLCLLSIFVVISGILLIYIMSSQT